MVGLVGKPRSGKTTLLLKIIFGILKNGGRILVIDPDGAEAHWDNPKFTRYEDIKDVPDNFTGCAVVYYSGKEARGERDARHQAGPTGLYSSCSRSEIHARVLSSSVYGAAV